MNQCSHNPRTDCVLFAILHIGSGGRWLFGSWKVAGSIPCPGCVEVSLSKTPDPPNGTLPGSLSLWWMSCINYNTLCMKSAVKNRPITIYRITAQTMKMKTMEVFVALCASRIPMTPFITLWTGRVSHWWNNNGLLLSGTPLCLEEWHP